MIGNMFELQNLIKHIVVVDGDRVTFNFADVDIKDNILVINKNSTHDLATGETGLAFDRLTSDQVKFLWDEAISAFKLQKGVKLTDLHYIHNQGGWEDLVSQPIVATGGRPGERPLWMDTGNGLYGYSFSDNLISYAYGYFNILHDISVGSNIYPNIHWAPLGYDTGTVVWKIEYVHAKGHGQAESLVAPLTTIYSSDSGNGIIGEHIISECSDLESFLTPEPDSLVKIRVSRDINNVLDTYYGNVILEQINLHYFADRHHTPEKSPDFYLGEV